MTRTVIIGGGVAGLATAALLAHDGHRVTVLERGPRLGGRVGLIERAGFRFDTGPSWYLMPSVFDHFFALLGTSAREQLDLRMLDPGYRVYEEPVAGAAARILDVPHGRARVERSFEEFESGSGAALATYLESARNAAELAEKAILYNPFTSVRSLARRDVVANVPQLASLLGTNLDTFIARRFTDPLLRQVLGYPAVFLGTEPRRAPAMYHLMSALDLDDGVQYPMGGFWRIIERLEHLAVDAGAEIVDNAEVTRILTERSGRRLRARGVEVTAAGGAVRTEHADVVVSAADLHHTETALLPREAQSYPASWWQKVESGPGAVIVLLGVRGSLPQLEHHTLLFAKDWSANFDAIFREPTRIPDPASLYVCKPSATDPSVAPAGHENLFVLVPVPADPGLGGGGADGAGDPRIEQTADAAIDRIAAWAGVPDLRERIVVRETLGPADFARDYHSWRGGMLGPAHILRQSAMLRAQNQSRRVQGLYYAGATTAPGVGVPMCLISAELVAKRLRGDSSAEPMPIRGDAS